MRPPETGQPFPPHAGGEEHFPADILPGIQHHDIEVAVHGAMLESIIEHDDIGATFPNRHPGRVRPPFSHDDRCLRKLSCDLHRFIPPLHRINQDLASARHDHHAM